MADFFGVDGNWDVLKLNSFFWPEDVDIIKQIPRCNSTQADGWVWHYDKRGSYNVRSGYKLYTNLKIDTSPSTMVENQIFWRSVWSLGVSTKIRHFLWKALHNILPAHLNLSRLDIDVGWPRGSCLSFIMKPFPIAP